MVSVSLFGALSDGDVVEGSIMVDQSETREQAQIQLILDEFGGDVGVDPPNWRESPDGGRYLYRTGRMLVRDRDLPRVRAVFGDTRDLQPDNGINGLTRYTPPPGFKFPENEPAVNRGLSPTLRHIAYVDWMLGSHVATCDHLFFVVPGVSPCPGDEPNEVDAQAPPLPAISTDPCDGEGVKVVVVDVGWSENPAPWLTGVTGDREQAFDQQGNIKQYAGHGTFIAGVIKCIAPKAEVVVKGVFTRAGATWESDLVAKLDEALLESPDIISLSAGTQTRNLLSSMGFDVWFEERLSKIKGLLMVCAAGNHNSREPFYPAASPSTLSVGALDANGLKRAGYSNYGHWVDLFAPGTDLINAFLKGTYICDEPPHKGERRTFGGRAKWSGTSFATPLVAGLVAARMSSTGENAQQAADALVKFAQSQAIPGLGAVIYPGQACGCK
jgi:subtilisin family serine protease